jgi:L-ascorbate metabolism protein UlaG (beta-lactamase superfamily)
MKIQFLGHSSFLIVTNAGTRIVTDPFDPADHVGRLDYKPFNEPADIVTVSHGHADHGKPEVVKGSPIIIRGDGRFAAREVEFLGVATHHDDSNGAQRGRNTVYVINVDGLRVAHAGDLGHVLTADQAAEIGRVDVALVPVGGYFTIDGAKAIRVAEQIGAKIVIPMHFRNRQCSMPLADVEEFLRDKPNVLRQGSSVLEVSAEALPDQPQIVVLEPAL